jgi:hypothetical protein
MAVRNEILNLAEEQAKIIDGPMMNDDELHHYGRLTARIGELLEVHVRNTERLNVPNRHR